MLANKYQRSSIGVIIGRFQTPYLHKEHFELIESVRERSEKVIILLGVSPVPTTEYNPLDFEARKLMINDIVPRAIVLPILDDKSDEIWSKNVDNLIRTIALPGESVIIYGSRNSFISAYTGSFETQELQEIEETAATDLRTSLSVRESEDFRAGVIWATQHRFKNPIPTVDIVIYNDKNEILLIKKPGHELWMLPGGFTELTSESDEMDARREAREETNVEIGELRYIGSLTIDSDWRYKPLKEKIRTHLFEAMYIFGIPTAGGDDVEGGEVKWFPKAQVEKVLESVHDKLWKFYINKTNRPQIKA
jgi:bifunctional NMN adenylyltransferase/nudix hydrolase